MSQIIDYQDAGILIINVWRVRKCLIRRGDSEAMQGYMKLDYDCMWLSPVKVLAFNSIEDNIDRTSLVALRHLIQPRHC